MKKTYKNIWCRIFCVTAFSVMAQFQLNAQDPYNEDKIDSLIDVLFFQEEAFIDDILAFANKYNMIYSGFSFNSDTYVYGRTSDIDQFNFIPFISYYNSKGFNVGISGIYYGKADPNWDFTNISLGYGNYFGKKQQMHIGIDLNKYFYTGDWDDLTNSADVTIGFQNNSRNFRTKLNGSLLFGNGSSFMFASKTSYRLTVLKRYSYAVKLNPLVNLIFSERTILTESINETYFGFIYSQLNIPLSFITKSWEVEFGYNLNIPIAHETEADLSPSSFFRISAAFIIDITK